MSVFGSIDFLMNPQSRCCCLIEVRQWRNTVTSSPLERQWNSHRPLPILLTDTARNIFSFWNVHLVTHSTRLSEFVRQAGFNLSLFCQKRSEKADGRGSYSVHLWRDEVPLDATWRRLWLGRGVRAVKWWSPWRKAKSVGRHKWKKVSRRFTLLRTFPHYRGSAIHHSRSPIIILLAWTILHLHKSIVLSSI